MSFVVYDLTFLVLFSIAIAIFLYVERKKLVKDGIMYLYKTSVGLKFMDSLAKRYPRFLKFMSYIIVITGVILLVASVYFIFDLVRMFMKPEFVKLIKIPPITPLIPYLPSLFKITWLPPFYFTYWIIAIALVAIFHEGFHGIFARFNNIRIKSSGFGFLGPFLAFFVEQDEKQMKKAKPFAQMTVLAAGVFANILLAIIFVFMMIGFFSIAYSPAGVIFNDYSYAVAPATLVAQAFVMNEPLSLNGANLTKIKLENQTYFVQNDFFNLNESQITDDLEIKLYNDLPAIKAGLSGAIVKINEQTIKSQNDVTIQLMKYLPGQTINVVTKQKNGTQIIETSYEIKLAPSPVNSSRAVMGIATLQIKQRTILSNIIYKTISMSKDPNTYYEPKIDGDFIIFIYNLLLWLVMINFGVTLANMWPVAIFDGGYFFYLIVFSLTKNKKIAGKALKISTALFLAVVVLLMVLWAKGMFWKF